MRLMFLGKSTQGGGSPTLYATDRATYVVQGLRVVDDDGSVEIPQRLLGHLRAGTALGGPLRDTGRGSFIVSGAPVDDPDALEQMQIPVHETCVEVQQVPEGGIVPGGGILQEGGITPEVGIVLEGGLVREGHGGAAAG